MTALTLTEALRRRRRRRRLLVRTLLAGAVLAVVAVAVPGLVRLADAVGTMTADATTDDAADAGATDEPADATTTDDPGAGGAGGAQGDAAGGSRPSVLLVNADHALPDDLGAPDLVDLVGTVPVSGSGVQVAAELVEPLRQMLGAAADAGYPGLYVNSGYRSAEDQRELWDTAEDRSLVQPPGHSEHQTGLAVDLADLEPDGASLADSSSGRWLADNAWRYGFILRYPAGKEEVTGIAYEAWHFRYVGPEVAEICQREGLTLEEYAGAA